ncbi:MAG: hypothetical protein HZA93_00855 [Verrucomicrobia bacterium]|nr:hypothetical protein [Verrucomicrobiota bacterium]
MDDTAPKENQPEQTPENPPADFNKIDLSQLQGFSFGTQWSVDKTAPSEGRDRPRREDRRDGPGGGPDRRDRRSFRRPAGPAGSEAPAGGGERREFSGDRPPRREGGDFRGGPRRDGPGGGGEFRGGPRRGGYGGRGEPMERGPYDSPYFTATFYPEDTSFNTLVQTIRKSCRTIELFEIARTVVAKTDRFVVVVSRKTPGDYAAPSAAAGVASAPAERAPRQPIYISLPDGVPFDTEEAAVAHVMSAHLDKFFDMAEVEVEAPKGNFQVINKCGVTGELLGPPNYHRYNQIVQQHHAAKVSRMAFEAFRSRIETVRDPEAVAQWLAKMKKTTRYTWKMPAPKAAKPAVAETPAAEAPAPAPEAPATDTPAPEAPAAPAVPTFDAYEDARLHLLTTARERIVRAVEHARFHGKLAETMPQGEIRRAIEGALERQRKFPLDTANALRGRLRREHFTIFKKGSKGVSYVCAVKRKFRVPGQTFADSIGALIAFVEAHPMVRASELPSKLLGINLPAQAAPAAAPAEGAAPATPVPELTVDERAKISRLQGDLMWLVREGYVTEFIDGTLYAPPPMVEARKKEVEAEEHDPENFPEAPPPAETPAPAAAAPAAPAEVPAEAPAVVEPTAPVEAASEQPPAPVAEAPAEPAPAPAEPKAEPPPA